MHGTYRPVPVDEEQQSRSSSETVFEKGTPTVRFQGQESRRARVQDFLANNWAWIAHSVLLLLSLTLFTLSFCQRTAKLSDLQVTQQYSSYCMFSNTADDEKGGR